MMGSRTLVRLIILSQTILTTSFAFAGQTTKAVGLQAIKDKPKSQNVIGPHDLSGGSDSPALSGKKLETMTFLNAGTGLGPFINSYLIGVKNWDPTDIGKMLSIAHLTQLGFQSLAGDALDKSTKKRVIFAVAMVFVLASNIAVMSCADSFRWLTATQCLAGIGRSFAGPCIAAITVGMMKTQESLIRQIAMNEKGNHIGILFSASLMGFIANRFKPSAIFYIPIVAALGSIFTIFSIPESSIDHNAARGMVEESPGGGSATGGGGDNNTQMPSSYGALLNDRRVLVFMASVVLFHFGNAPIMPMLSQMLQIDSGSRGMSYTASCIVVAHSVMIFVAGACGKYASKVGKKAIFLVGLCSLPVRCASIVLIMKFVNHPFALIATQILDGIGAGIFGVIATLTMLDLTQGSGRFNVAVATMHSCVAIGAMASNLLCQYMVEAGNALSYSRPFVFCGCIGLLSPMIYYLFMPETQDPIGSRDEKGS